MSKEAIANIFAPVPKWKTLKIEVDADIAARLEKLFADNGATGAQKRALYTLAFRKLFDSMDRPARAQKENNDA